MSSSKLLEIHVISAQDLPPVSKILRTYTAAWLNPEQKLSTKIDRHGCTNPTWNHKLVFRIDERFLFSENSAITFRIYNVAWLRDLPIGTAHFFIKNIFSTSNRSPKDPTVRPISLPVSRPSGHLQGTLNVAVSIVDNDAVGSALSGQTSFGKVQKLRRGNLSDHYEPTVDESIFEGGERLRRKNIVHRSDGQEDLVEYVGSTDKKSKLRREGVNKHYEQCKDDKRLEKSLTRRVNGKKNRELTRETDGKSQLYRSRSDKNAFILRGSILDSSELAERKKPTVSCGSVPSEMRPLPAEVAADGKKGLYLTGGDFGSSIFDNWTTDGNGDGDCSCDCEPTKAVRWENDDDKIAPRKVKQRGRSLSDGGGLFSCLLGNKNGFEFGFACGKQTNNHKKKKKKKMHGNGTECQCSSWGD